MRARVDLEFGVKAGKVRDSPGRRQSGFDEGADCLKAREVRLLREIGDARGRIDEALAGIGFKEARCDLQKRRFAGPVASDKRNARARLDDEARTFKERFAAKGEANAVKGQQRRGHERFRKRVTRFSGEKRAKINSRGVFRKTAREAPLQGRAEPGNPTLIVKILSANMGEAFAMEALETYLRETRTTPKAFAKLIGVEAERLARIIEGAEPVDAALARRMVDATGGALILEDLAAESAAAGVVVLDMRSRLAFDENEIDAGWLAKVLAECLPSLVGGNRRKGDDRLPGLAADAAVNTYLALSTVTTRRGADRLVQALRPVFAEILEDLSAPKSARLKVDQMARQAADLYFQGRPEKRRA